MISARDPYCRRQHQESDAPKKATARPPLSHRFWSTENQHRIRDNQTPHERAQWAADVRSEPSADPTEDFLPEALRRAPTPPLNKRTGRNRSD